MMMGEIKDSRREMGKSQSDYATLNEENDGGGGGNNFSETSDVNQNPEAGTEFQLFIFVCL